MASRHAAVTGRLPRAAILRAGVGSREPMQDANSDNLDATSKAPPPKSWLSRQVHALAALGEPPHRTALAFALGVFLSFSPFLGLQIALAFTAGLALRLHRLALLAGLCSNLPIIMVPYYVVTTAVGAAILGVGTTSDVGDRISTVMAKPFYRAEFWGSAADLLAPVLGAFVVGSLIGAAVLGVVCVLRRRPGAHQNSSTAIVLRVAPRNWLLPPYRQQRTSNRHVGNP